MGRWGSTAARRLLRSNCRQYARTLAFPLGAILMWPGSRALTVPTIVLAGDRDLMLPPASHAEK
jgi:pimeloyl-ACP methyl ester carboxylesterase